MNSKVKRVELRPDCDMIDNNFDGYKLSLDPLPTYSHIVEDVDVVDVSDELYSFQHVKSCSLHNHLHQDPWNRDHAYYVTSTECGGSITVNRFCVEDVLHDVFRLNGPTSVLSIPRYHRMTDTGATSKGDFNVTLKFPNEFYVILSDGAGTLYIIDSGDRSHPSDIKWTVCFSSNECASSSPFIILDTVSHDSTADGSHSKQLECLLLYIEEQKGCKSKDDNPFTTVLEWVTLSTKSDSWNINRTRRITGSSSIDYAALEPNGNGVCTISEKIFSFLFDSKTPVTTRENDDEEMAETNRVVELPAYVWMQSADDISIWFKFEESVKKEDVVFTLTASHLFLGLRDGSTLLQGLLFSTIDKEGSTWTLIDNRLEVTLSKIDSGLMWRELVKGNDRGEESFSEKLVHEIHERLAHLTSDKLNPDPQGNRAGSFNPQQLEECDTFPVDSYLLARLDGESHRVTHEVSLSSHQYLFSVTRTPGEMPALCFRHDVDGLLWQLPNLKKSHDSTSTNPTDTDIDTADNWQLDHVSTFNALGYVLASKQQKKFIGCSSRDDAFVVVGDVRRHLYIYHRPDSIVSNGSELRNRRTGAVVQTTAKQRVIALDNSDVLGLVVSDNNVFVLTRELFYVIRVLIN